MSPNTKTLLLRVASFVSLGAVLCGVLSAWGLSLRDESPFERVYHLGSLTTQWIPGLIFGVALGLAFGKKFGVVAALAASNALIYFLAVEMFIYTMRPLDHFRGGFLSGFAGALGVSVIASCLLKIRPGVYATLVTAVIGCLLGYGFIRLYFGPGGKTSAVVDSLCAIAAFLVWQVPVSLSVAKSASSEVSKAFSLTEA